MIRYFTHIEIDKQKWDNCINNAINGLIYAYSWFLDVVSPNWDALIQGDYEAVMPLTWKKKWGIYYLYPPFFTKQLGIFFQNESDKILVKNFIQAIPGKFRFIQIHLNEFNLPLNESGINIKLNNNYEIQLNKKYDDIYKTFNRNCHRNIKKAENEGLSVIDMESALVFVEFIKNNLGDYLPDVGRKDYHRLKNILELTFSNKTGEAYGAITNNGELVAIGSFLVTSNRCIFSVCASSEIGKSYQAMYMLVNYQIKKYAGSKKIFDFSGSNIPGIAYFNSTFGASVKKYPTILINRLPWPLKYLK